MLPSERYRVLLAMGVVLAVYAGAAVVILAWLLRRARGKARLRSRLAWVPRTIIGLAGLLSLCFVYGYFVEPYWLAVTHVRLSSAKLPRGIRPIRIVHASDFHCDVKPALEDRIPDVISAQKPDVIVFTGDAINTPQALPLFRRCLTRIAAIAPTFVVKGNWDAWYHRDVDRFGGTGARELDGAAAKLSVGGTELWIAGVPVMGEDRLDAALASVPPGAFTILLYHYPDLILDVAGRDVDLYLAGHTHGGQVALPLYGALTTLSKFGKRYEAGLYREGNTWLYVNRGIGEEGFATRMRFWSRPEITVIDIEPVG